MEKNVTGELASSHRTTSGPRSTKVSAARASIMSFDSDAR